MNPFTERKLVEIANGIDVAHDGRIYIECVNAPFLAAASRLGWRSSRACDALAFPV
jgi:hypothetical protein